MEATAVHHKMCLFFQHNGYPVPPALDALEADIDHFAAVELLSELMGKQR